MTHFHQEWTCKCGEKILTNLGGGLLTFDKQFSGDSDRGGRFGGESKELLSGCCCRGGSFGDGHPGMFYM